MGLMGRCRQVLVVACVGGAAVLAATAPASAADQLQPKRTLLIGERFSQTSVPATGAVPAAYSLLAFPGEREAFQLVVRNTTTAPLHLDARVTGDAALTGADPTVQLDLLRVGFITLPRGSTGLRTKAGAYADPLPELRPGAGTPGLLTIAPARWGGLIIQVRVRTNAPAGLHHGMVELFSGATVYARQSFSLDVRIPRSRTGARGHLLQPGDSPRAMKTVLGVEGDRYWLGHSAMRNDAPDRNAQLRGLYRFYDDHGFSPTSWTEAAPGVSGTLSACPGASRQLAAYFAPKRDIDPATGAFPARVIPMRTDGCGAAYEPTRDIAHTPGAEQDDLLRTNAAAFWSRMDADWRALGLVRPGSTYTLNPFDEPSDATAAYRRTMATQVPAATAKQRAAGRGAVKVFLSAWPRDERSTRACKRGTCLIIKKDRYGNRRMWDGRGTDDANVWMVPFSRLWGRPNDARTRKVGYDRTSEYRKRLAAIKHLRGGREVWGYNFYTATRSVPQLVIDAPGYDAQLQYWLLARDGHTGLYVSNSMIGWSTQTRYAPGTRLRERGAPFAQATYFRHGVYGYGAGWGTLLYPAYEPSLGLIEERDRNTELSRPTSSLRFEGMREGQEAANLLAMYRARFGAAKAAAAIRPIISDRMHALPATMGHVVAPTWRTYHLARRMELQRRRVMVALARE
jgi:hypothetical protein